MTTSIPETEERVEWISSLSVQWREPQTTTRIVTLAEVRLRAVGSFRRSPIRPVALRHQLVPDRVGIFGAGDAGVPCHYGESYDARDPCPHERVERVPRVERPWLRAPMSGGASAEPKYAGRHLN